MKFLLLPLAVLGLARIAEAGRLGIADVSHAPASFDPRHGEKVEIRFRLTAEARAVLRIFDGRNLLVREVASPGVLQPGDHRLTWDGNDQAGRLVPPEAYVYTLVATNGAGEAAEHDLTDLTGNSALPITAGKWDPAKREIHYVLPVAARVNIRAGLANDGPLLRTVIDWVARPPGPLVEGWDGFDASHVLDASHHPDLEIQVCAWTLPQNAILVMPLRPEVELIAETPWSPTRRVRKRVERPNPRAVNQIPIERRRDPRLRIVLAQGLRKDKAGLPIVRGSLVVTLDVDERDRARIIDQRFEAGFFVDGKFVFENEIGFLPMTWRWDTTSVNEGVHFITGNVWGYSGQFGSASVQVHVVR